MLIFKVKNYDLQEAEKTLLTAAASAGGASLSTENPQGFSSDDFIVAGNYRSEEAQLRQVDSISSLQILLTAALAIALEAGDGVTRLAFDKVNLQESTDGVTGWSDVVTQNIDVDSDVSVIEYVSGSITKYYRSYFKNSQTSTISAYSGAMLGSGFAAGTLGWFKEECARDIKDESYQTVSPQEWEAYLKSALRMLFPTIHVAVEKTMSSTAQTYSYDFPAGIDHIDRIFKQHGSNRPEPMSDVRIFNDKLKFDADIGSSYTLLLEGRTYFTVPDSDDDSFGMKEMHYEIIKWQAEYLALRAILLDKSKLNQYAADLKNVTENDVMNMLSLLKNDIKERTYETTPAVEAFDMPAAY